MVDFDKEHQLIQEALRFSEGEFTSVCKEVDDQRLYTLLETITIARNKILDAVMARTMERKPNPLQWKDADRAGYIVKTIESELLCRMKKGEQPSS